MNDIQLFSIFEVLVENNVRFHLHFQCLAVLAYFDNLYPREEILTGMFNGHRNFRGKKSCDIQNRGAKRSAISKIGGQTEL